MTPRTVSRTRRRLWAPFAVAPLAALAILSTAVSPVNAAAPAYQQVSGALPDGTQYLIRVPNNWNGTLLNDLDYAAFADGQSRVFLLNRGYALSGTHRQGFGFTDNDPLLRTADQVQVLDIFKGSFGKPERTIQTGCSMGGTIALMMAEKYGDKIDGVVAFSPGFHPVWGNEILDLAFVLKALLAPGTDLPVVGVPGSGFGTAFARWQTVLSAAQKTPSGRARIALGLTLAQWPTWGSFGPTNTPRPDPRDVAASEAAMYESAIGGILSALFRYDIDNPAGGVSSWNTGISYAKFYANADPQQAWVVRRLYEAAGLDPGVDIRADLRRVDAQPRITGDPGAINYWILRAQSGRPEVPLLHVHTIGDAGIPPIGMEAYAARVRAEGREDLFRQAFVGRAGHCAYSASEQVAAVEALMVRLDTGRWANLSDPESLNTRAKQLNIDESLFVRFRLPRANRTFESGVPHADDRES